MAKQTDTKLFAELRKKLQQFQPSSKETLSWYRAAAMDVASISGTTPAKVMSAKDVVTFAGLSREAVGSMLIYQYRAKDTGGRLPYWDAWPCIILVDIGPNYHYGLNCHYLSPNLRFKILEALLTLRSDVTIDDKTRLRISYQILKNSTKFPGYKSCFKKYLSNRCSLFKRINPPDWPFAIGLPIARWQKGATEQQVYNDTIKKLKSPLR